MVTSYIFFYKFDNNIITNAIESKVTYFYVGSYNDLTSANNKKNQYSNAIIYKDNGIYKVIIGVYNKEECIELMESFFLDKGITFRKKEMKVESSYIKESSNYELLIISSEKSYYENLNNSILKLFKEIIS